MLVSSPTHLPRCLRDACAFIHQRRCSHAGRKNSGLVAAPGASSGELEALRTTRAAQEAKTGKTEKEDDNNEAYEDQENNWVPLELLASPSETCYDGSVPSDVVSVWVYLFHAIHINCILFVFFLYSSYLLTSLINILISIGSGGARTSSSRRSRHSTRRPSELGKTRAALVEAKLTAIFEEAAVTVAAVRARSVFFNAIG